MAGFNFGHTNSNTFPHGFNDNGTVPNLVNHGSVGDFLFNPNPNPMQTINSGPSLFTHQIDPQSQLNSGHFSLALGQLDLSRRVSQIKSTTTYEPNRVHIHAVIDLFPSTTHPLPQPLNEELTNDHEFTTSHLHHRLMTPYSTLDRVLVPQSVEPNYNMQSTQSGFQDVRSMSLVNISPNADSSFATPFHQNHIINPQTSTQNKISNNSKAIKIKQDTLDIVDIPNHNNDFVPEENTSMNPIALLKPIKVETPASGPIVIGSSSMTSPLHNNDDDDQFDGKTHSLTKTKNGPYTCPKCIGVFDTSQAFASHVLTHYRRESRSERKRRLDARHRKRAARRLMYLNRFSTVLSPNPLRVFDLNAFRGEPIRIQE